MAHASEYLQLALERAVASVFPGETVPVLPVRQFGKLVEQAGKPVRTHGGKPPRTVTWSLTIGPRGARIVRGAGFVGTIDGSAPLMRNYLIEIHEPYGFSETGMTDVKEMAIKAMSNIEHLSDAIRYEIAGATGSVAFEYDEGSDASQGRAGYLSRQIEITLPAEFLPDPPAAVPLAGRLATAPSVAADAPSIS